MLHIGTPAGTTQAEIDMMVHKFGRTTSYTAGRIVSIDTDGPATCAAVRQIVGVESVRIVKSGTFRRQ